jgi:hypothetical protein
MSQSRSEIEPLLTNGGWPARRDLGMAVQSNPAAPGQRHVALNSTNLDQIRHVFSA